MTTMLRVTAIAGILTVSGLTLATTFAQDGPPPGGPGVHRRGPGGPAAASAARGAPWEGCWASSARACAPWS